MRRSRCVCGQWLFFDNFACERCGRQVGFASDQAQMIPWDAAQQEHGGTGPGQGHGGRYRLCDNGVAFNVCNWLVPTTSTESLCLACRLNRTVPNLQRAGNPERWARLEGAKRRLLYTLLDLGLPVRNRREDPQAGMAFEFVEDQRSNPAVQPQHVVTGHAAGVITINAAEADPVEQVRNRRRMNEDYRTLLGHMRHESGHYYWNRLIQSDSRRLARFRQLFGDETIDYAAALDSHYATGPAADWNQSYISSYASAHPWEDWAETWAHYLHMTDTLDTARDFALLPLVAGSGSSGSSFDDSISAWLELSVLLNELNRSMGQDDLYPFVVAPAVVDKLRFVDEVIRAPGPSAGS